MIVEKDTVVSFHYTLKESGGAELESNKDGLPMAYLHGHGNILTALEEALVGMSEGEQKHITLSPEQAYGARRENAQQRVPIKHLVGKYKRLQPGMVVRVNTEKGTVNGRVIKVGKFNVDLDMNHPFAGITLEFDVTIDSIRAASDDEIAHGHAHGPGGHHH
ncbi:FKBP-type peptidyl-prolyl cis-trans isomerase [Saccharophagus degradans]|nr:peptidylprolyl isomerase [Saccharophagus degradans]MBU2983915.1 peptidylprolyl isomerase [Saccharophagus degradans]